MDDERRTFTDVACTVCGCVCDDLTAHVAAGRLAQIENACPLAEPWFAALRESNPPVARVGHESVELADAIEQAAVLLRASRAPLVFGLSRSSTNGQRAAVALAERLGATVDTTASVCHGPSIMAIQQVGESTCSLGEVRNRADLVVFWGADPQQSHPRHFERYSVDPAGRFVPRGRQDRTIVVVDTKRTATSEAADVYLPIERGRDFEAIWALRQLIRGQQPRDTARVGLPIESLADLAERMKACRYGVVFFGLGLAQSRSGHANVEALLRLVAELNRHTRFTARRLRIPGDVTGADCVLCWRTGYAFAVNLARGYPRYNPGEYSANELLERREVDSCLLVGSESVFRLSSAAQDNLARLPTIVLDYPHCSPSFVPHVQFTTAVYGVHARGTAYRMDEIPVPLRQLIASPYPTDEWVLDQLRQRITY